MHDNTAAFSADIRDVIGAWLVCLAVAAASFGYPLLGAAWDASLVVAERHDAAGRMPVAAAAEICARHGEQTGRLAPGFEERTGNA